MSAVAIEAQDLRKVYADGTVALDSVSFTVAEGEIFGYLGRNGAGKTTTVRLLTTLSEATSGTARVAGYDIARDRAAVRRRIGVALQQAALDDLMTGRESLELVIRLSGVDRATSRRRVDELLERFGLLAVAPKLIATYSIGMRRRLDAAMALAHAPQVLFLDEPTTGLDPQSRRAVWTLVKDFRDQGGTVFLTTQQLDEADELSNRVAVLSGGRLAVVDTPSELKRRLGGKVLRFRVDDPGQRAAVLAALDGRVLREESGWLRIDVHGDAAELPDLLTRLNSLGGSLDSLVVVDPTLEDVFMRLTGTAVDASPGAATAGGIAALQRAIARTGAGPS